MNRPDDHLDDEVLLFLADYHEALLQGRRSDADTPPTIVHNQSLEGLQACLHRLDADRRHVQLPRTPAAPSQANGLGTIGRFHLIRELGRGGYGIVFLAADPVLKRQVALKVPRLESLIAPELRQRFLREAEAAAGLSHPNIVTVYEAGSAGSVCYIAAAYCPGPTLAAWLKEQANLVAHRTAAEITAALAGAMQHAHERGVLHRDLKPSNILLQRSEGGGQKSAESPGPSSDLCLLTSDLSPKITDFGLAKLVERDEEMTRSGAIVGTPSYMAPEQAAGDSRRVGPAADIHALGAILYELLTGRPPFQGPSLLDTLEQVRSQEPVAPWRLQPTVPRDLGLICLKCLHKEPSRRYASAAQLRDELRRYLNGEPLAFTRPVGRGERLWRWSRRNPALAFAVGVASLLLALVVGVVLLFGITATRDAAQLREANVIIGGKQKETDDALKAARKSATEAIENRHAAERQTVELLLDRGLELCEQGEVASGLLWLARSLDVAERSGATDDLRRVIRINLGSWSRELRPLRLVLSHTAGHVSQALGEAGPDLIPKGNPRPWSLGHRALAFSPDGRSIITSQGRAAQLWDAHTGQALGPALEHDGTLYAVGLSPDGKTLLTGSLDRQARFWDPRSGKLLYPPMTHEGEVSSVGFSPDGKTAVTAGSDGFVRLWDAVTRKPLHPPCRNVGPVRAVAFSPDSKLLLAGCEKAAQLWDVATGQPVGVAMQPLPADGAWSVAFAPDGKTCATIHGSPRLWDVPSGKPVPQLVQRKGVDPAFALAYSPDSRYLLATSLRGMAWLAEVNTGQVVHELATHGAVMTAAYSPDGRTCLHGGADGLVRIFDAATGKLDGPALEHEGAVLHAAYDTDGRSILTWTIRGIVQVWDGQSARPRPQLVRVPADTTLTAYSPDGRAILTAGSDFTAQVRDTVTGKPRGAPLRHRGSVQAMAYRPDGKVVLTGSADQTAQQWDATTGAKVGPPFQHAAPVQAVYWNSDGSRILTVTNQRLAQRWEAATGKPIGTSFPHVEPFVFDGAGRVLQARATGTMAEVTDAVTGKPLNFSARHVGHITVIAFSPDGRILATGATDMAARLWDLVDGRALGEALHHREQVRSLAISVDRRRVLTGGPDRQARLWDTGRCAPLGRPIAGVDRMAFSADGRLFFTVGGSSFRVWDATTGKSLAPLLENPTEIKGLALSTDGATVWTLGADNRRWDVGSRPLEGDPERIGCWIQVITGLQLDQGGVARGLEPASWKDRRERLRQLGGPPGLP